MRVKPAKLISFNHALALMRQSKDHRIVLMHTQEGQAYFVVPGGRMHTSDAVKIISRPDVFAYDDGPFPNAPQSWKMGHQEDLQCG